MYVCTYICMCVCMCESVYVYSCTRRVISYCPFFRSFFSWEAKPQLVAYSLFYRALLQKRPVMYECVVVCMRSTNVCNLRRRDTPYSMCVWKCVCVHVCMKVCVCVHNFRRRDTLYWSTESIVSFTSHFCKTALYNRRYSAKETYIFKEPTNRSHLIGYTYRVAKTHRMP